MFCKNTPDRTCGNWDFVASKCLICLSLHVRGPGPQGFEDSFTIIWDSSFNFFSRYGPAYIYSRQICSSMVRLDKLNGQCQWHGWVTCYSQQFFIHLFDWCITSLIPRNISIVWRGWTLWWKDTGNFPGRAKSRAFIVPEKQMGARI